MIDLKELRERADLGKLHSSIRSGISCAELAELLDQLEAAQKDAARYQWLRHGGISKLPHSDWGDGLVYDEREALDAHIDAAMACK